MRTLIIVQARMTSTRLPGKILKQVLDKPLLEYQIERLRQVSEPNKIVIATTTNSTDQPIIDFCERLGIDYSRGSEQDVLARYYHAAATYGADAIVRVTSDCPLIDPVVIGKVIKFYREHNHSYDYVSNCLERTYPRGMDVEVFSQRALSEAFANAIEQPDREHVTTFIYRRPQQYRLANLPYSSNYSKYRLTVDTPEDFELIRRVIEYLYPLNPEFSLEDVLRLLDNHPDWSLINAEIEQKKYGE